MSIDKYNKNIWLLLYFDDNGFNATLIDNLDTKDLKIAELKTKGYSENPHKCFFKFHRRQYLLYNGFHGGWANFCCPKEYLTTEGEAPTEDK